MNDTVVTTRLSPAPGPTRRKLGPETSVYLDCIRLLAVALVFLSHAKRPEYGSSSELVAILGQYGQQGVVLFFVISGLVIAHVAATRRTTFADFAVARLGRLWSVVVPAVALTIVLDTVGRAIDPAIYDHPSIPSWGLNPSSLWQAVAPILFLNQMPGVEVYVGSNGPFWSLCYECVYYVVFGVLFVARCHVLYRVLLAGVVVLVAGPNILSLAPFWILGTVLYRFIGRSGPCALAWVGWIASSALLGACVVGSFRLTTLLTARGVDGDLAYYVITYAVPAVLTCINILAFDAVAAGFSGLARRARRGVGWIVDRSFSIYLYQAPLLFFFAALTSGWTSRPVAWVCTVAATILSAIALAEVTELRRAWLTERLRACLARSQDGRLARRL